MKAARYVALAAYMITFWALYVVACVASVAIGGALAVFALAVAAVLPA
jgi:hypothetical protein